MYTNVSEDLKNRMAGDGRTFRARMTLDDTVIESGFVSCDMKCIAGTGTSTLEIGCASSTQLDITMIQPDISLTGREFLFELGLMLDDESIEYVKMGYFMAQKPSVDDDRIAFTAYDRMAYRMSGYYLSKLTYPCDVSDVCKEISSMTGITMKNAPSGISIAKNFDGYTYRQAVGFIAGLAGKFATFGRDGVLDFRWYNPVDYLIDLDRSFDDVVVQENLFQVGYISCAVDENSTLKAGDGTTGIATSNFLMTQEILDSLYTALKDMSYHPVTCSFAGDMCLDLGDIVQVSDKAGKVYDVPIMSLNFSFDGGLTTDIGSYGSTELSEVTFVSPTESYAQQVFRRLYADKLDVTQAYIKFATIEKLQAAEGDIKKLKTDKLNVTDADIKYAKIDFSNIGKAALEQFFAKSGLIENVVVGDQQITGTLVGVTILGDSIKGGTVIADKLVIKGEDGLYYKLNTDGKTVEKEQTDYNSLDGGVIRAKSITATKIAVEDLVAFGATIGGWHITDSGLYSGTKEALDNVSMGMFLGNDGQLNIGDSENFIMFYIDAQGNTHLAISADEMKLGKQNIGDIIKNITGVTSNLDKILNTKDANTDKHTDYITFNDGSLRLGDSASEKVLEICNESIQIYENDISVASFGEETRIGEESGLHSKINSYGFHFYDYDQLVFHIGYAKDVVDSDGNKTNAPFYTIGTRLDGSSVGAYSIAEGLDNIASGWCSYAEGYSNTVSGAWSHAEGGDNTVSGTESHAEGGNNTINSCYDSHVEGSRNIVNSSYSHAEGSINTASGENSHVEGNNNTASGENSHAEGNCNIAEGKNSHVEGYGNTASGENSHAGGTGNRATGNSQTVVGRYNEDVDGALLIVGNGTSSARSNAMVVTEKGDVQAGSFNGHTITTGTEICAAIANKPTATHVKFQETLPKVPAVLLDPLTTVPGTVFKGCSATNITTTGFDLYVTRTDNGDTSVKWVAIT